MQGEVGSWERILKRRVSRRNALKAGAGAGLGLAALSYLGCSSSGDQTQGSGQAKPASAPKKGGNFRARMPADPPNLDPHLSASTYTGRISGKVYSRLVRWKSGPGVPPYDSTIIPDLAEKWEQPDELTYVFKLRQGAKFHDIPPVNGREAVAEDVKYSFDRIRDPKLATPNASLYSIISSLDVVDKYTVKFVTKEPYAPFLNYMCHYYTAYILPREAVEKFGDMKKDVIGTGPFMLDAYERNVKMTLKRHPQYFIKDRPYIDSYTYLIIADDSTAQSGFIAGELDSSGAQYTELDTLKKSLSDLEITTYGHGTANALIMNTERKPFDNVKVRQAVKYAVDQQRMIDTVFQGQAKWGTTIACLFEDWGLPQDELKQLYKRDVAKAKQLLAEAGYPDGFKSTIYTTPSYGQRNPDQALLVVQDLKEVGIQLEYKSTEYAKHLQDWASGNFDMYFGDRTAGVDPDEFTYADFYPKAVRNFSRIVDSKLEELCKQQRRQLNRTERLKTIQEVQRYVAEIVPEIPTPGPTIFALNRGYVKGNAPHFDLGGTSIIEVWLDK